MIKMVIIIGIVWMAFVLAALEDELDFDSDNRKEKRLFQTKAIFYFLGVRDHTSI